MRTRPAIAAAVLVLGAISAPAASAQTGTVVYTGCTDRGQRPEHISLACADDGVGFDAIAWSSWTADTAVGRGTFFFNTCLPTCVDGNTISVKDVRITLSRPEVAEGVRYFSRIRADYPEGTGPAGMVSSTFAPYTPLSQR